MDDPRFWRLVDNTGMCWIWMGVVVKGYGRVFRRRGVVRIQIPAHRYAWQLLNGPIPPGLCVLHRCDTPLCVRPDHLFLGTNLDNIRDRDAKRRQATGTRNGAHVHPERLSRGEANGNSRLTADAVKAILQAKGTGLSNAKLAAQFHTCESNVENIVHRRTWKHIT